MDFFSFGEFSLQMDDPGAFKTCSSGTHTVFLGSLEFHGSCFFFLFNLNSHLTPRNCGMAQDALCVFQQMADQDTQQMVRKPEEMPALPNCSLGVTPQHLLIRF